MLGPQWFCQTYQQHVVWFLQGAGTKVVWFVANPDSAAACCDGGFAEFITILSACCIVSSAGCCLSFGVQRSQPIQCSCFAVLVSFLQTAN
jgi:hypothetical protein